MYRKKKLPRSGLAIVPLPTILLPDHYYVQTVTLSDRGIVQIRAVDKTFQKEVYIHQFPILGTSDRQAQEVYRHLNILQIMQAVKHDNIARVLRVLKTTKDIYIVQEWLPLCLDSVLTTQLLSNDHVQLISYQILRALKYAHSAGIAHRQLRVEHIRITVNCDVQVINFNTVRNDVLDGYSAPEVLLGQQCFLATDIWAFGCLLYELATGKRLFSQAPDRRGQLTSMVQRLGPPTDTFLKSIILPGYRHHMSTITVFNPVLVGEARFAALLSIHNPVLCNLLFRLLNFDTHNRLTAQEAITHPYFAQFHNMEDEPMSATVFQPVNLSLEEAQAKAALILSEFCEKSGA